MRILFLTDNFPPESNAPATRTYEHCIEWLKKGAEVTVITCAPNYPQGKIFPGYKNKWKQEEMMDGIRVIRVWSYVSPNRGLFRRTLDYMSFCMTSFIASFSVKTDIIIATSPQLFTAVSGYFVSIFKKKPWIMEIRDLWPESIRAVGAVDQGIVLKIIDQIVLFLYRHATQVVVVTDSFKQRLIACGVATEDVHVVKNGVHIHKFNIEDKDQSLIQRLELQGKTIVAYIGTHGMAHKLDFILDCALEVENPNIHFLFIGAGAMKSRLDDQAIRLGLKNVTMLDAIPKEKVASYISISDIALINLRKKDTFTKVIPSKIFENTAMRKPILLGVSGEAQEIIEQYSAGLYFEPENKQQFLDQLNKLVNDKKLYEKCQDGCIALAKDFDRKLLASDMLEIIEKTAKL